jgi:hypothetical protein
MSGGKKEAFARPGTRRVDNKMGIRRVFFMGLLYKVW